MLRMTLAAEDKDLYMTQIVLVLDGELDAAALRAAWERVRTHPLLRSRFAMGLAAPVRSRCGIPR